MTIFVTIFVNGDIQYQTYLQYIQIGCNDCNCCSLLDNDLLMSQKDMPNNIFYPVRISKVSIAKKPKVQNNICFYKENKTITRINSNEWYCNNTF